MKKILFALLLSASLLSCSKEEAAFTSGTYLVTNSELLPLGTTVIIGSSTIVIADISYHYDRMGWEMVTDAIPGCDKVGIAQWKVYAYIEDCNGKKAQLKIK